MTSRDEPRRQPGVVERDGVGVHWERFGDGEPTIAAAADVVDHPLAALEDAGAVPRPAPPGGHVRRSWQRPVGPTGGRRRLHPPRVRRRHAGRARRHGARAGRARRPVARARRGHCSWPPTIRERVLGIVAIAPAVAGDDTAPVGHGAPVRRAARRDRGLGEVQPPLLATRLRRLPPVLLRRDVLRAALDEADRGRHRLGRRRSTSRR